MPYSESLFLLLTVTRVLGGPSADGGSVAAPCRRPAPRSRAASGSCSRPALAVEALHQRREGRGRGVAGSRGRRGDGARDARLPRLLAGCGPATGWPRFSSRRTGSASSRGRGSTLWNGTRSRSATSATRTAGYWLVDWLIVVPVLVALGLRDSSDGTGPRTPSTCWGGLLIPLTFVFEDRPLMSMPRFVLPPVPGLLGGGARLAERLRVPRWGAGRGRARRGSGCSSRVQVNWYYIF